VDIGPDVGFPEHCESIFYPGRPYAWLNSWPLTISGAALGAFTVCVTLRGTPTGGESAAVFFLVGGLSILALSMFGMVRLVLSYRNTAVALTPQGVHVRDWRGRVWLMRWGNIEQLLVRRIWSGAGPTFRGEVTYLVGRATPEGKTTLKLATSSRFEWLDSGIHVGAIAHAIIEQGGLVPDTSSRRKRTWVPPVAGSGGVGQERAVGLGVGPASGESAPPECKWCGETFPVGTTTCPLCGRPLTTET
jgi:hypothetical protein